MTPFYPVWSFPGGGGWFSRTIATGSLAVSVLGFPMPVWAQETVEELQAEYEIVTGEHEVLVLAAEQLERLFDVAALAFDSARAAGDAARWNQAFTQIQELTTQIDVQAQRVEAKAQEVSNLRRRLLTALNERLEDLLEQAAAEQNPDLSLVVSTELWIADLRQEEPPVVTIEPVPNIVIRPTDDTASIRFKARMLDGHAEIGERQLAYNTQLLEELRREQELLQRSQDFRADRERFGDTRPPTGALTRPGRQPDPAQRRQGEDTLGVMAPHRTYEERIAALEAVNVALTERIRDIRAKAERFRREAGGVWA